MELLIVDESSFIGRTFLARMHFRVTQGKRRFFSELALDPNKCTFGDISIILVGDFGQLEPIDDWSMCDDGARFRDDKKKQHLWRHGQVGKELLEKFDEACVLQKIHRSKDDMWWTESCLRLRDFEMTYTGDYEYWQEHDLDRGHFTREQKIILKIRRSGCVRVVKMSGVAMDGSLLAWRRMGKNWFTRYMPCTQ